MQNNYYTRYVVGLNAIRKTIYHILIRIRDTTTYKNISMYVNNHNNYVLKIWSTDVPCYNFYTLYLKLTFK